MTRGNIHTFVGVDMEVTGDDIVNLSMDNYIDVLCVQLQKDKIKDKVATSAKGDLFDKDDDNQAVKLNDIWTNVDRCFMHGTSRYVWTYRLGSNKYGNQRWWV